MRSGVALGGIRTPNRYFHRVLAGVWCRVPGRSAASAGPSGCGREAARARVSSPAESAFPPIQDSCLRWCRGRVRRPGSRRVRPGVINMRCDSRRQGIGKQLPPACVRKRDGRLEEVNEEKLIASICEALGGERTSEFWRAELVASVTLQALRTRHGPAAPLATTAIASATSLAMDIAGLGIAASAYRDLGEARHRPVARISTGAPSLSTGSTPHIGGSSAEPSRAAAASRATRAPHG